MQRGFAPVLVLVGILVLAAVATGIYLKLANSDFENCEKMSGSRTSLSDPPICQTPDGKIFDKKDWRILLLFMKKSEPTSQNQVVSQTSQPAITPQPTPDETANWKTYINQKWKYQFKYPPQWWIDPASTDNQVELYNFDYDKAHALVDQGFNPTPISDNDLFKIVIIVDKDYSKADQWISQYKAVKDKQKSAYEFTNLKQISINGQGGVYFDLKSPDAGNLPLGRTLLESPNSYLVSLTFWRTPKNLDNIVIYQKILSTFKFTN